MSSCNICPTSYADVKKGDHVMIKSRPCVVQSVSHSKTGKHGHMKAVLTGYDVLTGRKYESMGAGHMVIQQFELIRNNFQVLDISEDLLSCLNDSCETESFKFASDHVLYDEMMRLIDSGKELYVTIVIAPVEVTEDNFVDDYNVDSYKETKL
jgi:translation initiation factor 5A